MVANTLTQAQSIAADGLSAYGQRLKIISQNLANAKSTGTTPGAAPYARQAVVLGQAFNKAMGTDSVSVKKKVKDTNNFTREYMPNHPAADGDGFVLMPNVNPLIELTDMMEASRDYERILKIYKQTTTLQHQTIALLK